MPQKYKSEHTTVVTNIKRNDCRLFHARISISKKEGKRKLFCFNLVITVQPFNHFNHSFLLTNK